MKDTQFLSGYEAKFNELTSRNPESFNLSIPRSRTMREIQANIKKEFGKGFRYIFSIEISAGRSGIEIALQL